MSLESSSGSKRRRFKDEAFLFPENAEVISLDDNEDEVKIDENGLDSENPITICSDEEKDDVVFGEDENLVFLDDSDEDESMMMVMMMRVKKTKRVMKILKLMN
jgi:hypothetical protein